MSKDGVAMPGNSGLAEPGDSWDAPNPSAKPSGRISAEAELRASRKRLLEVIEETPAGYFFIGEDACYRHVNPAWLRMHGYENLEEVLGQHFSLTQPNEDLEAAQAMINRVLKGEPIHAGEFNRRLKDGSVACHSLSARPVIQEGKIIGLEGFLIDITERKRAEEQLRHAQKMEAVGQLAGGVAHDFNNILAAALINVELLQQQPSLPPEVLAALSELAQGMQRAASLTRQLLLFSRRQVMQVQRVDFNELVEGLMKLLQRLLGEHIEVVFRPSPRPVCVEADPGMLEQVTTNLCVNARDAMPKGGRLELSLRLENLGPEAELRHSEARAGRFVCLKVADTGVGMDEATMKRIFEPFFTTKAPGKGTGLGLATVHGIILQHRGWVEVESVLGCGATFRVFLPAVASAEAARPKLEAIKPRGGTETILLVEDESQVRCMVAMALRLLGYQILEAGNGVEALRVWATESHRIHLLFTDMVMPEGLNGLDLAERLRQHQPQLKVVISSGYSTDLLHCNGKLPAGIRFLPKPYDPSLLARTVRESLDQAG